MKPLIIAIDFDGTIVDHRFPEIGNLVPGAVRVIKELAAAGHKLILHTMRSDLIADASSCEGHRADRPYLTEAVEFCRTLGIEFWGVNQNPDQESWTLSPKPYSNIYIDDAALGCPMRENPRAGGRAFVDWDAVESLLKARGALPAS